MSNGITDKLMSLFKKDEEPIIEEGQSVLDEWKSTNYKELYPKMPRNQRGDYRFPQEKYNDLIKKTGLNIDSAMVNLAPILKGKNQMETHKRMRSTIDFIWDIEEAGMTKEDNNRISNILFGKHDSWDSLYKSLDSEVNRSRTSEGVELEP